MRAVGRIVLFLLLILPFGLSASAEPAPSVLKVGLLFGLTGAASPIGPVQRDGAVMAMGEINEQGGVQLGGRRIPVTYVIRDDETKPDVAIRRFRELVYEEKVHAVVGQTFAPISGALNKEVKRTPAVYFPVNVVALDMFRKNELAPTTFAPHGSAYSIGYASVAYIVKHLGFKNLAFFAPAYAFGWDQWAGAKDAISRYGASAFYIESPVGTPDFTQYLLRVQERKPDIVMMAHWGVDAINVLKQAYEMGLKERTPIWFNWMTNAFGSGIPPEALDGVYSLMSWYWNMEGFEDQEVVAATKAFSDRFMKRFGYPPDPYSAMAYVGVKEAVRGIELAQSTDPVKVSDALMNNPKFDSMRGPGEWRVDHQPLFRYGAFVVVGKGPKERTDRWDLVRIVGAYTGEDYLPPLDGLGY